MYIVVSVLIAIAAVLLILIVLVQNSKGGGLASNFAGSNQVMGVRKTTDFVEKATWYLSIFILVACIAASATIDRGTSEKESAIKEKIENTINPGAMQNFPAEAPAKKSNE